MGWSSKQKPSPTKHQWIFQVPLKGGRWHIIPQLAVYTTYIPLIYIYIYCLLGGYIIPTTLYRNLKNPLKTPIKSYKCPKNWVTGVIWAPTYGGPLSLHFFYDRLRRPTGLHQKPSPNKNTKYLCAIATGNLHPFSLCKLHPLRTIGRILSRICHMAIFINFLQAFLRGTLPKTNIFATKVALLKTMFPFRRVGYVSSFPVGPGLE